MYKTEKVHGEEYWMFKHYHLLFSNVQMLTILPLSLTQEDVPNACLKPFFQNHRRKETL